MTIAEKIALYMAEIEALEDKPETIKGLMRIKDLKLTIMMLESQVDYE